MSVNEDVNTRSRILELISAMEEEELGSLEQWICSKSYKNDLKKMKHLQDLEKPLKKIGCTLKKMVPFEAEMPTENIIPPIVGDQSDCNKINTCHVDEFLYDENDVEKLIENGKLKKHYCLECGSRNTQELIFISHSMSRKALQYIFKVLLPEDLSDRQILDVGSRLGSVLYGAYYYSNAAKIVGVELNKECCEIQEKIINNYSIDKNRMEVIHSDITNKQDIVESSNIIIINVLDFFVDVEKHKNIWHFFKKHIKKGSYIIANRSMVDTLNSLDMLDEFMDWLNVCKPYQQENEIFFDLEDYSEIYLYTVN